MMRRRQFLAMLGGAVVTWPLAARAQQRERTRRIGVLINFAADDPAAQSRLTAFLQGLAQLGWTEGGNAHIDVRWGAGDTERIRKYAAELVALDPDVMLTSGVRRRAQCCRRLAPSRWYSCKSPMRSAAVSWKAWHTLGATRLGSRISNTARPASGWTCSRRSRLASNEQRFFAT